MIGRRLAGIGLLGFACAQALAVLDVIERERLAERVHSEAGSLGSALPILEG